MTLVIGYTAFYVYFTIFQCVWKDDRTLVVSYVRRLVKVNCERRCIELCGSIRTLTIDPHNASDYFFTFISLIVLYYQSNGKTELLLLLIQNCAESCQGSTKEANAPFQDVI